MTLHRKFLIASFCALLAASTASAQESTPIPKNDHAGHDHAKPETPTTILPGTFSELEGEHTLGEKTAPLSMIIYASVTCPHCAHWFQDDWPQIKTNYVVTGKLRVVFREFPTAPAQLAIAGFQIANCAPEDKYFSLIEHQMNEQDNIIEGVKAGKGLETYLAIAKLAGLENQAEMNACFDNEEGRQKMQNAMDLAASGGLISVPNFIIGGELYTGQPEYLPLKKHLDTQLVQQFTPFLKK